MNMMNTAFSVKWENQLKRFEEAMVRFNITGAKRKQSSLLLYGGKQLHTVDTLSDTGERMIMMRRLKKL